MGDRLLFEDRLVLGCVSHNPRREQDEHHRDPDPQDQPGLRRQRPTRTRAIDFYESIGFEKRTDIPFGGGYRWVEVYPPEGTTGIALAPPPPDRARSSRRRPASP